MNAFKLSALFLSLTLSKALCFVSISHFEKTAKPTKLDENKIVSDDGFGAMASLRSLTESPVSTLDPNATAYTPKGNLVTSTEA